MVPSIRAAATATLFLVCFACYDAVASQCTARAPTRPLTAEFSQDELAFLRQILPKATNIGGVVSRVELRAPFHIPCQLKSFPHLTRFKDDVAPGLPQLTIAGVAQPPHWILFDSQGAIVDSLPIPPAWTPFQLREFVLDKVAIY